MTTRPKSIVRNNHYVPQSLIRRWSRDGSHVYTYRTLVSHRNVDLWKRRAIRSVASLSNFYTVYSDGQERDDFEQLIARAYEDPALKVIDRVISEGKPLSESDSRLIGLFVALQDLRTPLGWSWILDLADRVWQPTLNRMAERIARRLEGEVPVSEPEPEIRQPSRPDLAKCFRFTVVDSDSQKDGWLNVQFHAGRRFVLGQIQSFLSDRAEALGRLSWSVVEPSGNREWHLTDHPAIRLNYYRRGVYNFDGAWGKLGSEIPLPVSPRHLLYAKIGAKNGQRFQATGQQTREIQKLQLQRAFRCVFATGPSRWIEQERPREVNLGRYLTEERVWDGWHEQQLQAEIEADTRKTLVLES